MSYVQKEHILRIAKIQGLNVGKHPYQEAFVEWRKIEIGKAEIREQRRQ